MGNRHELNDFQKGQILALEPYFSHAEISRQLAIPHQTIVDFIGRSKSRKSIENLPRPGRPRKTSETTDRWLIREAESESRLPLQELKTINNIDVTTQTLHRRLLEAGIRKWRAVKRPLLTQEHAHKRLEWAKAHRYWTLEDWMHVLWSDECAVQKDSQQSTMWVFRRQNMREKYDPHNVRPKARDGGLSQMIWACFIGDKLGPIVFFQGTVNQNVYQTLINDSLVPFIEALKADGYPIMEFQQDNASPHTAKKTMELLNDIAQKLQLKIMGWPPNSPDLNPIEHLWSHVKRELHKRFPDTSSLKGSPEAVRAILRQRLQEVWWDIKDDVLIRLVESMQDRVNAVLDAKGWYTRY